MLKNKKERKPNGYYSLEKCRELALECTTKKDFKERYSSAHTIATNNKWIDEICSHMEVLGSLHKRFIYAYEFPDNSVYIGLTYNFLERQCGHKQKGTVYDYIKESGLVPKFVELVQEPVDVEKAKELEDFYLQKYRDNGCTILNKAKTGGLGRTTIKLTKELCQERALECNTKGEFEKKYNSSYNTALKRGWISELCSHMIEIKKPKGFWTFDRCKEVSKLYKNRSSFKLGSNGAFDMCKRNEWLDILFPKTA